MEKLETYREQLQAVQGLILEISDDLTSKAHLLKELFHLTEEDPARSYARSLCDPYNCPHRQRLKQMLSQIIEELEKTKKAFKSKQLETLRRRLSKDLAEL